MTEFGDIDLLAVHWRTNKVVDLISVEAKLDFTARLVQQARALARSYTVTAVQWPRKCQPDEDRPHEAGFSLMRGINGGCRKLT